MPDIFCLSWKNVYENCMDNSNLVHLQTDEIRRLA